MTLRVWVNQKPVGRLDRLKRGGSTFVYDEGVDNKDMISLTMPVQTASWDVEGHLAPIFDMNLPEGRLRETLRLRFAKALGSFDDFALLSLVGKSQIGRLRYTGLDQELSSEVPFHSVQEILHARKDGDLFDYLVERFATYSGVAGVQPKIMFRGDDEQRKSQSFKSATHIVKFWDKDEYPELAANEFFCLSAARQLGLDVPEFALSDDGAAIVVKRFDVEDGVSLGFEDFTVLNAKAADRKYEGGAETAIFKRIKEFVHHDLQGSALVDAFSLFALNCALRNGDAHLKNWGVVYEDADSPVRLAPVYDVVTTKAYVPVDDMALTVNGTKRWLDPKKLTLLGQTRAYLHKQEVSRIFERVADALSDQSKALGQYFNQSPHPEVGEKMLSAWSEGVRDSLGLERDYVQGFEVPGRNAPARLARDTGDSLEL